MLAPVLLLLAAGVAVSAQTTASPADVDAMRNSLVVDVGDRPMAWRLYVNRADCQECSAIEDATLRVQCAASKASLTVIAMSEVDHMYWSQCPEDAPLASIIVGDRVPPSAVILPVFTQAIVFFSGNTTVVCGTTDLVLSNLTDVEVNLLGSGPAVCDNAGDGSYISMPATGTGNATFLAAVAAPTTTATTTTSLADDTDAMMASLVASIDGAAPASFWFHFVSVAACLACEGDVSCALGHADLNVISMYPAPHFVWPDSCSTNKFFEVTGVAPDTVGPVPVLAAGDGLVTVFRDAGHPSIDCYQSTLVVADVQYIALHVKQAQPVSCTSDGDFVQLAAYGSGGVPFLEALAPPQTTTTTVVDTTTTTATAASAMIASVVASIDPTAPMPIRFHFTSEAACSECEDDVECALIHNDLDAVALYPLPPEGVSSCYLDWSFTTTNVGPGEVGPLPVFEVDQGQVSVDLTGDDGSIDCQDDALTIAGVAYISLNLRHTRPQSCTTDIDLATLPAIGTGGGSLLEALAPPQATTTTAHPHNVHAMRQSLVTSMADTPMAWYFTFANDAAGCEACATDETDKVACAMGLPSLTSVEVLPVGGGADNECAGFGYFSVADTAPSEVTLPTFVSAKLFVFGINTLTCGDTKLAVGDIASIQLWFLPPSQPHCFIDQDVSTIMELPALGTGNSAFVLAISSPDATTTTSTSTGHETTTTATTTTTMAHETTTTTTTRSAGTTTGGGETAEARDARVSAIVTGTLGGAIVLLLAVAILHWAKYRRSHARYTPVPTEKAVGTRAPHVKFGHGARPQK